jgi:hypothetical protein
MGIEPTSEAWEASILPLNYARTASKRNDSITLRNRLKLLLVTTGHIYCDQSLSHGLKWYLAHITRGH